ncbi:MAG: hypothetical protein N3A58_04985 [Spirochaetes bacterium]|nr:hypothetical protein [Spirochaetota bacterium]
MKKKLIFLQFLFFLISTIFFIDIFGDNDFIKILLNKDKLNCEVYLNKKINNEIRNLIINGYEANVLYDFALFKKSEGFSLGDVYITKYSLNFNLAYENNKLKLYNKNSMIYFESFEKVEEYIFRLKIDNIFLLKEHGSYYVKFYFSFDTIKLLPPFSIILIFVNIYSIKVDNLISNIISYEQK